MREGFEKPNHTQTPNSFFDALLTEISSIAELKITLTLIRETFGWHRPEAELSFSDFQEKTGLTRQGVANGLELCLKRGTVTRRENGQGFVYRLQLVNEIDQSSKLTSQVNRPEVVNLVDQKVVKEIDQPIKDKETVKKTKRKSSATQRAAAKQKPHGRDERKRDPRSNYAAIKLVKQLTGYYPRLILYDKIIATLGDHPDFKRAEHCAVEWASRGFRMDNHNWIFDWYVNGIPEVNGNGRQVNGKNFGGKVPVTRDFTKYPARSG